MAKDKPETPAEAAPAPKALVSANPALVDFPRDQWGMTSEFRRVALKTCASVRGSREKHDLLVATLRVIAQHAAARFPKDAAAVAARVAALSEKAEGRATQRVFGQGVPTPEKPAE